LGGEGYRGRDRIIIIKPMLKEEVGERGKKTGPRKGGGKRRNLKRKRQAKGNSSFQTGHPKKISKKGRGRWERRKSQREKGKSFARGRERWYRRGRTSPKGVGGGLCKDQKAQRKTIERYGKGGGENHKKNMRPRAKVGETTQKKKKGREQKGLKKKKIGSYQEKGKNEKIKK